MDRGKGGRPEPSTGLRGRPAPLPSPGCSPPVTSARSPKPPRHGSPTITGRGRSSLTQIHPVERPCVKRSDKSPWSCGDRGRSLGGHFPNVTTPWCLNTASRVRDKQLPERAAPWRASKRERVPRPSVPVSVKSPERPLIAPCHPPWMAFDCQRLNCSRSVLVFRGSVRRAPRPHTHARGVPGERPPPSHNHRVGDARPASSVCSGRAAVICQRS